MSPMQKSTILLVVAGVALAVYFSLHSYPGANSPTVTTPVAPATGETSQPPGGTSSPGVLAEKEVPAEKNAGTYPDHPLMNLALHHCRMLEPASESVSCLKQIAKDIAAENFSPTMPEINPLACNDITDPKKQHDCHGWMGHDFAVSTGDASKCRIIPQPVIKASCLRLIKINEIKQLYGLETASTSGKTQP